MRRAVVPSVAPWIAGLASAALTAGLGVIAGMTIAAASADPAADPAGDPAADRAPAVDAAAGAAASEAELCVGDFQQLAGKLRASYAEVPVSSGLGQDGRLVSVFASPSSGSWTMVTTVPDGPSCVVAVGESWQIDLPASVQPRV